MGTTPVRSPQYPPDKGTGVAILGKSVTIKGQILGREDLTIDGDVEGSIELKDHRLTIGPAGNVRCGIKAREVVILGNVQGKVDAIDRIEIRSNATLVGDIRTARVVIEDGAYFKGAVDITRKETSGAGDKHPEASPVTAGA